MRSYFYLPTIQPFTWLHLIRTYERWNFGFAYKLTLSTCDSIHIHHIMCIDIFTSTKQVYYRLPFNNNKGQDKVSKGQTLKKHIRYNSEMKKISNCHTCDFVSFADSLKYNPSINQLYKFLLIAIEVAELVLRIKKQYLEKYIQYLW